MICLKAMRQCCTEGGAGACAFACGIEVAAAGTTDFHVGGCRFGNGMIPGPAGGTQAYPVRVLVGASDRYLIVNNLMAGSGGVVDGGTGTSKAVSGNVS